MNEWGEVDRPVGSSDEGVRPSNPDASPWGQQASRDERLALSRSGYASLTADRRVRCTAGTPAWSEIESLAADGRATTNGCKHVRIGYGYLVADRRADENDWTIRDPNASSERRLGELRRTVGP